MSVVINGIKDLIVSLVASVMLIILGIVYFSLTLFIVKIGSEMVDYTVDGNWAVLTAGLITLGVLIGSSSERRV